MYKKSLYILVLGAGLTFAAPVLAAPAEQNKPMPHTQAAQQKKGADTVKEPQVDPGTIKKAQEKYEQYIEKITPLNDELTAKTLELNSIEKLAGTTRVEIKQLVDEIMALRKKMRQEFQGFTKEMEAEGMPFYTGYHDMYGPWMRQHRMNSGAMHRMDPGAMMMHHMHSGCMNTQHSREMEWEVEYTMGKDHP